MEMLRELEDFQKQLTVPRIYFHPVITDYLSHDFP